MVFKFVFGHVCCEIFMHGYEYYVNIFIVCVISIFGSDAVQKKNPKKTTTKTKKIAKIKSGKCIEIVNMECGGHQHARSTHKMINSTFSIPPCRFNTSNSLNVNSNYAAHTPTANNFALSPMTITKKNKPKRALYIYKRKKKNEKHTKKYRYECMIRNYFHCMNKNEFIAAPANQPPNKKRMKKIEIEIGTHAPIQHTYTGTEA